MRRVKDRRRDTKNRFKSAIMFSGIFATVIFEADRLCTFAMILIAVCHGARCRSTTGRIAITDRLAVPVTVIHACLCLTSISLTSISLTSISLASIGLATYLLDPAVGQGSMVLSISTIPMGIGVLCRRLIFCLWVDMKVFPATFKAKVGCLGVRSHFRDCQERFHRMSCKLGVAVDLSTIMEDQKFVAEHLFRLARTAQNWPRTAISIKKKKPGPNYFDA